MSYMFRRNILTIRLAVISWVGRDMPTGGGPTSTRHINLQFSRGLSISIVYRDRFHVDSFV